jgi:hypothetical protein
MVEEKFFLYTHIYTWPPWLSIIFSAPGRLKQVYTHTVVGGVYMEVIQSLFPSLAVIWVPEFRFRIWPVTKTTGFTIEDSGRRIVLARQNVLLQKGAQAHGHSKHQE